jgi:putative transposase
MKGATMSVKTSYRSAFKAQVVLEILKEEKTLTQIASAYGIHPSLVRDWKALALHGLPSIFEKRDTRAATEATHAQQVEELYAEIGWLTTQVTWLKKTNPVAGDIPPGEKRSRLPFGACSFRVHKRISSPTTRDEMCSSVELHASPR